MGYFLTAGLTAEIQFQIVLTAIQQLNSVNIRVISLVMDGLRANQSLVKLLSGSLDPDNILSSFPHPDKPDLQVYMYFNACHLIKLVRTALHVT